MKVISLPNSRSSSIYRFPNSATRASQANLARVTFTFNSYESLKTCALRAMNDKKPFFTKWYFDTGKQLTLTFTECTNVGIYLIYILLVCFRYTRKEEVLYNKPLGKVTIYQHLGKEMEKTINSMKNSKPHMNYMKIWY